MGSTGTGKFSDYPGSKSSTGGAGAGSGGGQNPCDKAFNARLEDVERCSYYQNHSAPPPRDTEVEIIFKERLCAATRDGVVVGYLPTKFNYLAKCIKDNYTYEGIVVKSLNNNPVVVEIDVTPIP